MLGRPYHVLLGIGIGIEIVKRVREFAEESFESFGVIKTVLAILLFLALLVHQTGELSEYAKRRRKQGD